MADHHHHQSSSFFHDQLSRQTSILGLRLWVVLGFCVGASFVLLLFLISLWFTSKRNTTNSNPNPNPKCSSHQPPPTIPNISRDIREIIRADHIARNDSSSGTINQSGALQPCHATVDVDADEPKEAVVGPECRGFNGAEQGSPTIIGQSPRIHIESGKDHRIQSLELEQGSDHRQAPVPVAFGPDVSQLGWGRWFTLRELEEFTDGFSEGNVIGEGGYGVVYHGLSPENTQVAVKALLNNRGQAEKEFEVEVEAIGRVRHKNLVRLIGYCAEGADRLLVYEYVNNGNLEQWLHGDVGSCSPLTWDIRMNIILGTAKGLAYLHEGLEPKVVHRDIKSSNILLDKGWNPKLSDFGMAKLLGGDSSYVATRVMGTFGYVAPEYASTGMLTERSDVYGFGILILEIISGRNPVDYSRPTEEVNLVEWLKKMVGNRNPEGVLDPRMPEKPSLRALKRALLVALRCVDPNSQRRPKMGHVVHMLEVEDNSFREDRRFGKSLELMKNDNNIKNNSGGNNNSGRKESQLSNLNVSNIRGQQEE